MALEDVKRFFKENNLNYKIYELDASTATVELAAQAHGVEPGLIAKTLAVKLKDNNAVIVTKGDAKIDNKKFKATFNLKCKMLSYDEVLEATGHPVGGVCPFGLKTPMNIYLDVSLKDFEYVYPAAGGVNTSIKIAPHELQNITKGNWVDICKEQV